MHEHDMDLIMALAEGTLGESDAAAAGRAIASCETCTADLALQRAALDALSDAPRVYLTATESARLRSNVRSELGLSPSIAPTRERRPRRFAFGALAGAAAVLLAVVVAGPALDILGSDEDTAPSDVALSAPAAEINESTVEADRAMPEEAAAPVAAAPTAPEMAGAVAPAVLELESEDDLVALKSEVIRRAQDTGREFDGAELFAFGEPDLSTAADSAVDELPAAPPAADPTPLPAPAPEPAQGSSCDPDAFKEGGSESATTIIQPVRFQGVDAVLFAYIAEPAEDSRLVVVDAATCELLAGA